MPDVLINLDVPDLPTAERFYTQALGLTVTRRLGAEIVELGGATAPMGAATRSSSPDHRKNKRRLWRR